MYLSVKKIVLAINGNFKSVSSTVMFPLPPSLPPPSLVSYVREQLVQTVALMVKRATLEEDRRTLFDSVFTTVSQLLLTDDSKMVYISTHHMCFKCDATQWFHYAFYLYHSTRYQGKSNNSTAPRTTLFFQRKEKRAALGGIRTHDTLLSGHVIPGNLRANQAFVVV